MPLLEPLAAGKWNGHSLWVQFNAAEAPEGYCVEINRLLRLGVPDRWVKLDAGRSKRNWLVVPVWNEGAVVQVRVKVNGVDGEPETARECVFRKSTCVFAFSAGPKPLRYEKGTAFHAAVDGAACGYSLQEDIEIEPGGEARATMISLISSGFAQLDREGHFVMNPGNGVRIWNVEPSANDVELTGRDYTILSRLPIDGPLSIVRVQPKNPVVR